MKSYTYLTLAAMLISWAAGLGGHALLSIPLYGSVAGGDTQMVAFWSAPFMLLAWGLFILLPEKWILKVYRKRSRWGFVLFTTGYALLTFTLLIGWIFLQSGNFWIVYADAAVIGGVFGLAFRLLVRWSEKHYRRPSSIY
ncbi:hypothetical protein [Cesiribacter andamanensis]|uniref:Uncharacterized protein n=1 Tax=Cesiribacter andamanensis AMV16 TaxID=1279009 RepID=M7N5V1_9BACT|nr:hypothetical protein [Cesiribacter andamanensis]EMR02616.1 hypothetical protein ADICEAN_02272 [Cesiribacter andamanensis AMV16]